MTHIATGNPQLSTSSLWIKKTWVICSTQVVLSSDSSGRRCMSVPLWIVYLCIALSAQCSFTVTDVSVFSDASLHNPPWSFIFFLLTTPRSSLSVFFSCERNVYIPFLTMSAPSKLPYYYNPLHYCFKGLSKWLRDAFIHLGGSIYSMGGLNENQTLKWCTVSVGLYQSSCRGL